MIKRTPITMKIQISVLMLGLALIACKKDEPKLSGNASTAAFTFVVNKTPGGDTLPFRNVVAFTNNSSSAFTYLWDFGDANTSVLPNPVHTFGAGSSFLVRLTSVGQNGNNTTSQTVSLESPCDVGAFNILTACGNKTWAMSPAADAITILSADGGTVEFSGAPADCQSDDEYTFSVAGTLNYDAKGQTFVANEPPSPYSCRAPQPNASRFFMIKPANGNPRIVLDGLNVSRNPFLGTTDQVVGNSYEILSITESDFTVEGILTNGQRLRMKFRNATISPETLKIFLTGGSRKTWRLDSTAGANAIVVGTEANPTEYYAGGPLADCQKDDWYTFTETDSLVVNCNGSTLLPALGFSCGDDKSFRSVYGYGAVAGGRAGLAQVQLTANDPNQWIGVYDRANENVYRILSINNSTMLLRAGNGSGVVHTMKFVVK